MCCSSSTDEHERLRTVVFEGQDERRSRAVNWFRRAVGKQHAANRSPHIVDKPWLEPVKRKAISPLRGRAPQNPHPRLNRLFLREPLERQQCGSQELLQVASHTPAERIQGCTSSDRLVNDLRPLLTDEIELFAHLWVRAFAGHVFQGMTIAGSDVGSRR
jgi:hypothetical protein